ncbi:hypothetical protein FQR65_LT12742 [Abscondita terminalis]|nr:hypothetical protein FQR65_LT12742 [Abscondita terminalis]
MSSSSRSLLSLRKPAKVDVLDNVILNPAMDSSPPQAELSVEYEVRCCKSCSLYYWANIILFHQEFPGPPCKVNGQIFPQNCEQSLDRDDVTSIISRSQPSRDEIQQVHQDYEVAPSPPKRGGKDLRKLMRDQSVTSEIESDGDDFVVGMVTQHEKVFINNIRKTYKKVMGDLEKVQKDYNAVKLQVTKLRTQLESLEVTWLHHKEDSIHLLTVGRSAYSSDERITLSFRYPNNFRLEIVYVTRRDEGLYECQVATHPPKVKRLFLKVTAPEVTVVDESGREVTERYYKAGSALELTCIATQVGNVGTVGVNRPIIWRQGDRTLTMGISMLTAKLVDIQTSISEIKKQQSADSKLLEFCGDKVDYFNFHVEEFKTMLSNIGALQSSVATLENGIDIQSMRLLKDSDLNELIKPIGMRVKFRENLVLWQRNLHEAEEQAHINNDTFVDVDSNTLIDISNRIIAATGGGENIQNQLTETSDIIIPDNNIISSNAFSCREKENSASNTLQFLDSNFVSKLLNESIDGKGLLAAGKHSGGLLNESQRRELGRLIIRALLERSPSIRIQSVSFTRLSLEINSIFPREPAPIYFTPSVSASKYSKKQNACGVLYEAYISRRRKLRAIGELAGTSRSRSSSLRSKSPSLSVSSVAENEESLNFEDNPILEEHLRWLETGVEPWTIVQLYWKDTASFRLKHLQHNRGTVSEYFNKYPSLKLNQGYRLLLNESIDGKGLLAAGKHSGGLLNESQRRELGRLIIRALLERSPSIRIQSVSFTRLSLEINSIFPREPAPIYFTPSVSASKYSKKQNACGVLYEAYISRRRKLRAIGELAGTSRSRSSSLRSKSPSLSVSSVAENEESLNFEDNPILEEHLRWLETGVEPWTIVQLYWKDTASFRLKHLQHNRGTVSEYFNKYPSLKLNQGYRLLLEDFSLIQPEKENNLFSNIILLKESLLKIATEKRKTSRDVYYKQQLDMYVTTGSSSHADSSIGLLLLLPYILAAPTGRKVGGKLWRPSRVEVRDAFITHVPSDAEIIPTIEGSDLTTIVKSIVVVDNTFYTLPTPLQAVDAAFKIFHSTGACYPEEATDVSIGLLLLLPYILAAPTGRKVGGKLWRPSRVEVRDAFITHVPSDAEIIPTIEGRKNKYTSLGRTFQPLIIIVGSDLTTIVKSIVVVDNTFYTLPTPLQAVDAAFKIFHSTGACYPEEATDVWLLIQRAFYQFHTNFDRLSQSLKHVLTDLGIVI